MIVMSRLSAHFVSLGFGRANELCRLLKHPINDYYLHCTYMTLRKTKKRVDLFSSNPFFAGS